MVKVFAISDLHLELRETSLVEIIDSIKWSEADVLVLAGDISNSSDKGLAILDKFFSHVVLKYKHIIYVPGNHEYYCSEDFNRLEALKRIAEVCQKNKVILLNRDSITIEGTLFIGTTLWSAIEKEALDRMNDFKKAFKDKLDYLCEFVKDYTYLKNTLEQEIKGQDKIVVITHHLPTNRLVHPKFLGYPSWSAFSTEVLDNMNMHQVKLWIAGHTHEYMSVKYGNSKLIVNPVGYPGEVRVTKVSEEVFDI